MEIHRSRAARSPRTPIKLAEAHNHFERVHPFIDGNKRTAFVCTELFLVLNGTILTADDADCVATMLALAAGDLAEADFAAWLRSHTAPPEP